jgi:hypothetical protein
LQIGKKHIIVHVLGATAIHSNRIPILQKAKRAAVVKAHVKKKIEELNKDSCQEVHKVESSSGISHPAQYKYKGKPVSCGQQLLAAASVLKQNSVSKTVSSPGLSAHSESVGSGNVKKKTDPSIEEGIEKQDNTNNNRFELSASSVGGNAEANCEARALFPHGDEPKSDVSGQRVLVKDSSKEKYDKQNHEEVHVLGECLDYHDSLSITPSFGSLGSSMISQDFTASKIAAATKSMFDDFVDDSLAVTPSFRSDSISETIASHYDSFQGLSVKHSDPRLSRVKPFLENQFKTTDAGIFKRPRCKTESHNLQKQAEAAEQQSAENSGVLNVHLKQTESLEVQYNLDSADTEQLKLPLFDQDGHGSCEKDDNFHREQDCQNVETLGQKHSVCDHASQEFCSATDSQLNTASQTKTLSLACPASEPSASPKGCMQSIEYTHEDTEIQFHSTEEHTQIDEEIQFRTSKEKVCKNDEKTRFQSGDEDTQDDDEIRFRNHHLQATETDGARPAEFLDFTELDAIPYSQFVLREDFLSDCSNSQQSCTYRGRRKSMCALVQRKSPRLSSFPCFSDSDTPTTSARQQISQSNLFGMAKRQKKTKKALLLSSAFQFLIDEAKRSTNFKEFSLPQYLVAETCSPSSCPEDVTMSQKSQVSRVVEGVDQTTGSNLLDSEVLVIPETEIDPDLYPGYILPCTEAEDKCGDERKMMSQSAENAVGLEVQQDCSDAVKQQERISPNKVESADLSNSAPQKEKSENASVPSQPGRSFHSEKILPAAKEESFLESPVQPNTRAYEEEDRLSSLPLTPICKSRSVDEYSDSPILFGTQATPCCTINVTDSSSRKCSSPDSDKSGKRRNKTSVCGNRETPVYTPFNTTSDSAKCASQQGGRWVTYAGCMKVIDWI